MKPKRRPWVVVQKIQHTVEKDTDARLEISIIGDWDSIDLIIKELRAGGQSLLKHAGHSEILQCASCIVDAMGKEKEEVDQSAHSSEISSTVSLRYPVSQLSNAISCAPKGRRP